MVMLNKAIKALDLFPYLLLALLIFVIGRFSGKNKPSTTNRLAEFNDKPFRPTGVQLLSEIVKNFESIGTFRNSPSPCGNDPVFLLILIHSAPRHFLYRSTIRKTWGRAMSVFGHSMRIVFLLGFTDLRIQAKLSHEKETYHDIVQGNFVDSYKNLTYKHLMGYYWFAHNCQSAKLVMKADDDIFVDIFRVISVLRKTFGPRPFNFLGCLIIPSGTPTNRNGKWSVTREEYPLNIYPEYCSGMAYFASPDVIEMFLQTSLNHSFFWIDDVLMTGFIAEKAGVRRADLSVWFAKHEHDVLDWLNNFSSRPIPWMITELSPNNWPYTVHKLWNKTVKAWGGYVI